MDGNRYQNEDRYRDKMEQRMMGRPDKGKDQMKGNKSDKGKGSGNH